MDTMMYRTDIDGLRSIAILTVLAFHAFPGKFKGGFVGVDIFFVISGFLISRIIFSDLENKNFCVKDFYIRRARRIFPALIIVLLSVLLLGRHALFLDEYRALGFHAAAGSAFVMNFVLNMEQGYFDTFSELKPLLHLWSLAIEEQFYIFWPILIWFLWTKLHRKFLITTIIIGVTSFALNLYTVRVDSAAAYYLPFGRFWELMIGSILAYFFVYLAHLIELKYKQICSFIGLSLIAVGLILIDRQKSFPGYWALLPSMGAFFIILSGPESLISKLLSNRALVGIGLISYPLYLWHWPVFAFAKMTIVGFDSVVVKLLLILISFLLAWITYRFIETPIRKRPANLRESALIAICLAFVGILGLLISHDNQFATLLNSHILPEKQSASVLSQSACEKFSIKEGGEWDLHCRALINGDRETFIFYGDSHAAAGYDGLAEEFSAYGFNSVMLASWGCPMLIGLSRAAIEEHQAECERNTTYAKEAMDKIFASGIKVVGVAIATRGPLYMSGKNYTSNGGVFERVSVGKDAFRSSLQETISYLGKKNVNIFYITENPELGFNPRNCSRPLKFELLQCALKKSEVLLWQKDYLDALMTVSGAGIINSIEYFCPDQICYFEDDKKHLMYRDSDHLNSYGGAWAAKFVLSRVQMKR
ncbi:acyltransferase family protein [Methylocystis sp.]